MEWYASQTGTGQAAWFRLVDRRNVPSDGISIEEHEQSEISQLNYHQHVLGIRESHLAFKDNNFEIIDLELSGIGP